MLVLDEVELTQDDFRLSAHWRLPPGERVALIGPSGAGKSTLLMAIAGFFPVSAGQIRWDGWPLTDLAPGDRPVSILFQDQNLFPHLTLAQNLGLALSPGLRLGSDERAKIEAALTRVGLAGLGERRPGALSGGQQGRAALARVLLQARPILLLDEPFAALGPALKSEMLDLVAEIAAEAGTLVLLVTHDPEDAQRFGTRTILVSDGVAAPPTETLGLFANPSPALRAYLGK